MYFCAIDHVSSPECEVDSLVVVNAAVVIGPSVHTTSNVNAPQYCTLCPEKKRPQFFMHSFDKCRRSFVIFGTNHPQDAFCYVNSQFIRNIITTLRSDDVIVTSSETTLSRTASGKDTTIFCLITLEN